MSEVRVDKFLWAMRIYKTRSIAADACKNGRISMGGVQLKPSRTFHVGDTFNVRKGSILNRNTFIWDKGEKKPTDEGGISALLARKGLK